MKSFFSPNSGLSCERVVCTRNKIVNFGHIEETFGLEHLDFGLCIASSNVLQ